MDRHPERGQRVLERLTPLREAARLVRSHHERWDGRGFPDRLAGEAIPLGARILAVADAFDALQNGGWLGEQLDPEEARAVIEHGAGSRFDPRVVEAFSEAVSEEGLATRVVSELRLASEDLRPGMVLMQDLREPSGAVLLARGRVLTEQIIARLHERERERGRRFVLRVRAERAPGEESDAQAHAGG